MSKDPIVCGVPKSDQQQWTIESHVEHRPLWLLFALWQYLFKLMNLRSMFRNGDG